MVGVLSPRAYALYQATFPGYPRPAEPVSVEAIETHAIEHLPETEGLPAPERDVGLADAEIVARFPRSCWAERAAERLEVLEPRAAENEEAQ